MDANLLRIPIFVPCAFYPLELSLFKGSKVAQLINSLAHISEAKRS